jgi:hypothetical protein
MKKVTITFAIAILVLFLGSTVYSQNVYVKLGGGYGLSLASQFMHDAGVSPARDLKYGSFGEGINFGLGFGYNVNSNLAFELAGSYILGKKFENTVTSSGISTTDKDYANTICIMPSVVVKAPMKDVTPYTRFGMIIGIPTKFNEETQTGTGALTGTDKFKETGGLAMGIQGALGINFKAGKNLGIFAEVFGIGMNYAPSTLENTETYTGGTLIPKLTYEESWTPALGDYKLAKPRYSFSSFGMNVGLTYTFGK